MKGNPLGSLPERAFQLSGLINVQKAFLQNCSLSAVHPTAFLGLEILIELDLSNNGIRELEQVRESRVPCMFLIWQRAILFQDGLSMPFNCQLSTFHAQGTFAGNNRTRKLWLGHNPLHSLAGFTFPRIHHLRQVDLGHCRLNRLGRSTFMMLEDLEVLRLNDNRFRRLDKRVSSWHFKQVKVDSEV